MEKYTAYKPSGIKWIGDIPEHWECNVLKRYLKGALKYGANESAELDNPDYPRYIRITDITLDGKLKEDTFKSLEPEKAKDYLLKKGDVLFARSGATVGKSFLFDYDINACFAGYLIKATCSNKLNPKFLFYYTLSKNYDNWRNSVFVLSTIQNIGADKYAVLPLCIPPAPEQEAIVAYLEKATANIDAYIKQTEQEINTLNELKQAEIAQVVTKGLNPDAPMKDSGIAWIGEIPEHWECKRIGSTYIENKHINSDLGCNEAYKFNYGSLVRKDEDVKLEEVADVYSKYTVISKNDIIINGLNLNYDFVTQRVAIVEQKGIITSAYVAITPREDVNSEYFSYLFKSMDAKKLFNGMGTGIRLTLGFGELKKQQIPIPPKDEQDLIVKNIKAKTSKIEEYITALKSEIAQMQEYKQRLISDVVTGKMKV